jgi:hypothetical protein
MAEKRGASLVTAAALALSVLFCSQQVLDSYVQPGHLNQPQVHTVQHQSLATRGGRTVAQAPPHYKFWESPSNGAMVKTESIVGEAMETTSRSVQEAIRDLLEFMKGPKSDTLLLLNGNSTYNPFL